MGQMAYRQLGKARRRKALRIARGVPATQANRWYRTEVAAGPAYVAHPTSAVVEGSRMHVDFAQEVARVARDAKPGDVIVIDSVTPSEIPTPAFTESSAMTFAKQGDVHLLHLDGVLVAKIDKLRHDKWEGRLVGDVTIYVEGTRGKCADALKAAVLVRQEVSRG